MSNRASPEHIRAASKVLAKIKLYDATFPVDSDGVVMAWATQLTIANIPEDIALEAVDRMYARVTDVSFRPLPGALLGYCRDIRRERLDTRAEQKAVEERHTGPPRISLEEWEARHGVKFPKGGPGKDIPDEAELNPLRVPCSYCRAGIGTPCTIPGTRLLLVNTKYHPSRKEAAECLPASHSSEQPAPTS